MGTTGEKGIGGQKWRLGRQPKRKTDQDQRKLEGKEGVKSQNWTLLILVNLLFVYGNIVVFISFFF